MLDEFCLELVENKEFTSFQSIYFPINIILSDEKLKGWYYMNYMLPVARTDGAKALWCDLTDAYVYGASSQIYSHIMKESTIGIDFCNQISNLISLITANIIKHKYCVIFLDFYYLSNSIQCFKKQHFVHELLFYGFTSIKEKFLCFGYMDGEFHYLKLLYSEVTQAFQSALDYITLTNGWEEHMFMTFQRVDHPEPFPYNADIVIDKIKQYVSGNLTPEFHHNKYLYQNNLPNTTYAFGIHVTDVFLAHMKQLSKIDNISFFIEFQNQFPAFHMYRDFHVSIWKRLQYLLDTTLSKNNKINILVQKYYCDVINKCNVVRLLYLKLLKLLPQKKYLSILKCIEMIEERLIFIQNTEQEVLTEFLDQLIY